MAFWRSRSPADRLRMTSRGTAVRTPRHLTPETVCSSIKLAALHPISWLFMFGLFTLSMPQISKRMNALFWNIYLYLGSNYRWQPCNAAALAKERSWMVPYHSDVCGSCAIVSGLYAPGSFLAWLFTMLTVLHKQQMTVLQNQNAPSSGQPTPTPASDAKRLLDPPIGGLIYSIASSIDLILRTIRKDTKAPLISANKVTCLSLLFATYRMYLEAYVSSSSGSLSDSRRLPQRQRQSLELRLWEVAFICSSLVLFIHGLISKIRGQVPTWLALQFLWAVLCIYIFL
ncbi:hypothetical protein F5882DRAFT_525819 [Hyaloscypha sp. PMI_1271]|nr:hypothetical protein F5882DRAFT_525819 [Hyaloscypha sp. PMI_1271]